MWKRFVLWDFPRASWQYDVMVGAVLAFIFLMPRAWFGDQPRETSIVMLPAENGSLQFFVDEELLAGTPESLRVAKLTPKLERLARRHLTVTRVEPILKSEGEVAGYLALARP